MFKNSHRPDYFLAGIVISLLIFGILILTSIAAAISYDRFGNTSYYLKHQIVFALLPGLILAFIAFKIDLTLLKKLSPFLFLLNLIFMGMVFLPGIGLKFGGARRWVGIGSFLFQPAEFLKISFIVYLASLLANWDEKSYPRKPEKKIKETLLPFILIFSLTGFFLYLQKDISTLGIILIIAGAIYFSANTPFWHILLLSLGSAVIFLSLIAFEPYRLSRLLVILNKTINPTADAYQLSQALITIGSGGIFGVGLGMSRQRFGFLPEAMSDAIFPILAEETGFVGSLILILFFLAFMWRGFRIIRRTSDSFLRLAAVGISSWIVSQAFINIAAMTGILPIAGIPLPFISYGGSALISELIGVGLLLNISKQTI